MEDPRAQRGWGTAALEATHPTPLSRDGDTGAMEGSRLAQGSTGSQREAGREPHLLLALSRPPPFSPSRPIA